MKFASLIALSCLAVTSVWAAVPSENFIDSPALMKGTFVSNESDVKLSEKSAEFDMANEKEVVDGKVQEVGAGTPAGAMMVSWSIGSEPGTIEQATTTTYPEPLKDVSGKMIKSMKIVTAYRKQN